LQAPRPPLQDVDLVKTERRVRLAREDDIPALEELIALSARGLRAPYYSEEQVEAALGSVFGVDRQLFAIKPISLSSTGLQEARRPSAQQPEARPSAAAVGANAKHFSAATTKRIATTPS